MRGANRLSRHPGALDDSGANRNGEPTVQLAELSRALDEIYELRRLLAYHAAVTKTYIEYKTFPKNRRPVAELQIQQMLAAAGGGYPSVVGAVEPLVLNCSLRSAGIDETMTRHLWRQQRGIEEGSE